MPFLNDMKCTINWQREVWENGRKKENRVMGLAVPQLNMQDSVEWGKGQ